MKRRAHGGSTQPQQKMKVGAAAETNYDGHNSRGSDWSTKEKDMDVILVSVEGD